jgi:nicotinic acid mononucleotide adenylyltransferase/nicotinamide mononucleotide (NMN) deamidase PncC
MLSDPTPIIDRLTDRGRRLVLISSGGGSAAITALAGTPGASAVLLEGLVPYAREAVDALLGGPQESYCSARTARRLAVAAWQRAARLSDAASAPTPACLGAAVTASLRTRAPKRGQHRVFAATHSLDATRVAELVLEKGARTRAEEEAVAAATLLAAVANAVGGEDGLPTTMLKPGEQVMHTWAEPPAAWRELAAGQRKVVAAAPAIDAVPQPGGLVFPGSFDPLHDGHLAMAALAAEIAERPVAYELSITNVDKPALDWIELRDRAAQFASAEDGQPQLWLTRAATFLEKLELFPQSTFVMGADTYVRLADPRYYGGSADAARAAVQRIATEARGLIVFGRVKDGVFQDPTHLDVPQPLRDVTYFVSQREFRLDVSSTAIRRRAIAAEEEGR